MPSLHDESEEEEALIELTDNLYEYLVQNKMAKLQDFKIEEAMKEFRMQVRRNRLPQK